MSRQGKSLKPHLPWRIFIDGAARGNPGPAGVGIVLHDAAGRKRKEISTYLGEATNNVAESLALVLALQEAVFLGSRRVHVCTDSELLARQVQGSYRVKDPELQWLHVLIRHLLEGFEEFEIQHVPREKNKGADRLANRAVTEGLRTHSLPKKRKSESLPRGPSSQATFW